MKRCSLQKSGTHGRLCGFTPVTKCSKQMRKHTAARLAWGSQVAHEIQKSPREMQISFLFIILLAQRYVTKYVAVTNYASECGRSY